MDKTLSSQISKIKRDLNKYLSRVKRELSTNVWTYHRELLIKETEDKTIKGDKDVLSATETTIKKMDLKYSSDKDIVDGLIKKNEHFLKEFEEFTNNPLVKEVHSLYREASQIHYKRLGAYLKLSDNQALKLKKEEKDLFIGFDSELQLDYSRLRVALNKLDIGDDDPTAHIQFRGNRVCPLIMHPFIKSKYPEVQEKLELMGIDFESRPEDKMLIEYKQNEIPFWDATKHYWNQTKEALQFYVDELKKNKNGIYIGEEYIHPWLYTHLNVSKFNIPTKRTNPITKEEEVVTMMVNPPLRDNEWWLIQDNFRKASKIGVNKKMAVVASRRVAKTTMLVSKYVNALLQGKKVNVLAGSNSGDLAQVTRSFLSLCSEVHPAFDIPLEGKTDTEGEIQVVIKTKDQKNVGDQFIVVVNTNMGASKSSEKLAGYSMEEFNWDEFMKAPYLETLRGAEPAYKSSYGYRTTPMFMGCVCAGTKVWNNSGDLVNIEELTQEEGILGYSIEKDEVTQETITWMKPPAKKPCYRITTNKERVLECSDDHPILKRHRDQTHVRKEKSVRKIEFVRTDSLVKGDHIMVADSVPYEGKKRMWEPRLVGLLIGDGSYGKDKTPKISTADEDINSYVENRYDTVTELERYTKDGRIYKETRIRGICKELRKLGIYGQTRNNKRLPKNIHSYTNEDIYELIGGLFDADGHVNQDSKNNTISITSANIKLVEEIKLLLQKIGIHCSQSYVKPNPKNPKSVNGYYILNISDKKSVIIFHDNISFLIKRKQDKLNKCYLALKDRMSKTPIELDNARIERVKSIEYIGYKKVYNLTAGNTNTYIANGIITHNTGGNEEMSSDALIMLSNLEENDVYEMDWDLFESRIPQEEITWNRRDFATFIPAQMAEETNIIKDTTTLDKYLGKDDKELSRLEIRVTNWKNANDHFNSEVEKLKGDSDALRKYKVYYPRDPGDVFLSGDSNPYPADIIKQLRIDAEKQNNGSKYFLSIKEDGNINRSPSSKPNIKFPFSGGNYNAPTTIFEEPVDNPPEDFYTAGLDDVQQETSGTDSVRAIIIWRRDTMKVVASLFTRPVNESDAYVQMHCLLKMYNCMVFMENVNMGLKSYFDGLGADIADQYIMRTVNFLGDIEMQGHKNRKYGYAPTGYNNQYLHSLVYKKMTQKIETYTGEGEEKIVTYVYARQEDPRVLRELEMYSPNRNLDGYDALRGAIALDHYLTYNNIFPKINTEEELEEKRLKRMLIQQKRGNQTSIGNMGSRRQSQFSKRRKRTRSTI